jgi:hypothetical protein
MYDGSPQTASKELPVQLGGYTRPARRGRFKKIVMIVLGSLFAIALVAGTGFYFYWQSLKSTPQYSLALIVDAAKRNDQTTVNRLVDIDAVVDDFLPQITNKAVELYGRGLPPTILKQVAQVAAPVMPAVKDRAREELPGAIRQKTAEFGFVPFEAMVLGAERYLDIKIDGDSATVKSLVPEQDFEVRMKRDGSEWKIVAVKDDKLATNIAQRVGQEIIAIAANGPNSGRSRLGVKNINDLLNEAEKIFR